MAPLLKQMVAAGISIGGIALYFSMSFIGGELIYALSGGLVSQRESIANMPARQNTKVTFDLLPRILTPIKQLSITVR